MAPTQVVVGTDGSPPAQTAVGQAAREAKDHGVALRVVHAIDWVPPPGIAAVLNETGERTLRATGERLLAEAVSAARLVAPDIEITRTLSMADPRSLLTELSSGALVTVVGDSGTSGIASGLLGSVSRHLTAHAASPVLVVRTASAPEGPIVLGVDGSRPGETAIEFAFVEAAARNERLTAVHVWSEWKTQPAPPADPALPFAKAPGELAGDEERLLAEALSGWSSRYPQVAVDRRSVKGRARQSLIEASRSAQLLVVGSRGAGGFAGLRLGSVSAALSHHAHCPVAVVPARE
ncbi:universal stress protein [Streptomyces albus]|uniref:universal stress protein n=1 Tax=Streptomyces albus TaxID=1888 RepID=UPI0036F9CD30